MRRRPYSSVALTGAVASLDMMGDESSASVTPTVIAPMATQIAAAPTSRRSVRTIACSLALHAADLAAIIPLHGGLKTMLRLLDPGPQLRTEQIRRREGERKRQRAADDDGGHHREAPPPVERSISKRPRTWYATATSSASPNRSVHGAICVPSTPLRSARRLSARLGRTRWKFVGATRSSAIAGPSPPPAGPWHWTQLSAYTRAPIAANAAGGGGSSAGTWKERTTCAIEERSSTW